MAGRKAGKAETSVEPKRPTEQPPDLLKQIRSVKRRASKRSPGRPTTDQSDKISDALLKVALHSFMDRGFEGSTIDAIAKDAKVARITIYRRFGDKKQLFREVAHFAQTAMHLHLKEMVNAGPPDVVLRGMIEQLLDVHTRPDYLAILRMAIFEAPRFPEVAASYMAEGDFALGPLIDYLEHLKQKRIIAISSAREAALQFTDLSVGGARFLMLKPPATLASRAHWIDSVYTTFARAWGLDTSHLSNLVAR